MSIVDPSAVVAPTAELGKDVEVGPFAVIGPKVRLGNGVKIGAHALVEGRTQIDEQTVIHPFATLGVVPQDLKYQGEDTSLFIGKRNQIREYTNISIGTQGGGGKTVIGNDNLIMVYTHIAHDCIIGNQCVIANAVSIAGHVEIQDRVVIGGMAGVHQFARIGQLAMIAAGAMVAKDVPPFCMVHGNRAEISGLNVVGLRRAQLGPERVKEIKSAFQSVYKSGLTLEDAIYQIANKINVSDERDCFLSFLRTSERGICR